MFTILNLCVFWGILVKKSKKKGKMVRKTIAVMLNYLQKDIRVLLDLLAKNKMYYESLCGIELIQQTLLTKNTDKFNDIHDW